MENQNIRASIPWEHSLTNLLGHDSTSDPGIALRQWVHFQGVQTLLDLLSWEEEELKAVPAQQVFTLDDHGQGSYLRTNQVKQIFEAKQTFMFSVFNANLQTDMGKTIVRRHLAYTDAQAVCDTFYTKIPIAPCYCQMMGRTLKEEIKITQYNNPTKAGKYSLEDLFRASDNIPHHYPKF